MMKRIERIRKTKLTQNEQNGFRDRTKIDGSKNFVVDKSSRTDHFDRFPSGIA